MTAIDVAYDARETSHMSIGMRQYARELQTRIPRIAPDLRFAVFGSGDNFDVDEQVRMPLWIAARRPKLVHYPTPYAPLVSPAKYVVTIHDLIDLHFPQWTKANARWYYRVVVRRLARRAACVITDDEATADDIVRFYGIDRERIAVIPLGIDACRPEPIVRSRPYAIYAGNRRPHKDLATLIAGWLLVEPSRELDLVLTGPPDPALAARRRERGDVVFLGDLEHGDVLRWIAGASVLLHAALREGFGLPLLEAASAGTPVVVTESAVPRPLADVVRTFTPGDADALARAVEGALDGGSELAVRAREVAATLTWDRCAQNTANVYRQLL